MFMFYVYRLLTRLFKSKLSVLQNLAWSWVPVFWSGVNTSDKISLTSNLKILISSS